MNTYILLEDAVVVERVLIRKQTEGTIPRRVWVEDPKTEGGGYYATRYVSADWYTGEGNLRQMSDGELHENFKHIDRTLGEAKQAELEAMKRGASKEEIDKVHQTNHSLYWTRRHLGREVKSRELEISPERTVGRAKGVKRRKEGDPSESKEPMGEAPDMLKAVLDRIGVESLSPDEKMDYYVTGVVTGKYRASAYLKFLQDRGLNAHRVTRFFHWNWGAHSGASRAVSIAGGMSQGYSFEDMWNRTTHIPTRYSAEATKMAAEELKEALPHVATWAQTYLKSKGIDRVSLFFPIPPDDYEELGKKLGDPSVTSIPMGLETVSMATTNKRVAEFRAKGDSQETRKGGVVTLTVPVERILHFTDAVDPTGARFPEILVMTNPDETLEVPRDQIDEVKHDKPKVLPKDITLPREQVEAWDKDWVTWQKRALGENAQLQRQMEFRRRTYGNLIPEKAPEPWEWENEEETWQRAGREWREARRELGLETMLKQEESNSGIGPPLWTTVEGTEIFELGSLPGAYSWLFETEYGMAQQGEELRRPDEHEIFGEGPGLKKKVQKAVKTKFTLEEAKKLAEELGADVNPEEFRMGLEAEMEHTRDPETRVVSPRDLESVGKIAWAHLKERPDYYSKLATIEKGDYERRLSEAEADSLREKREI